MISILEVVEKLLDIGYYRGKSSAVSSWLSEMVRFLLALNHYSSLQGGIMVRKLHRSRSERMIWGVCGGLARHLNVDPTLVRLVMVLLVFANGLGILIYIIMAVIVPLEGSKTTEPRETMRENVEEIKKTAGELGEEIRSTFGEEQAEAKDGEGIYRWRRELIGTVLIVAGLAFLVENFNLFWFDLIRLWPLLLVGAGLLFILTTWRRRHE